MNENLMLEDEIMLLEMVDPLEEVIDYMTESEEEEEDEAMEEFLSCGGYDDADVILDQSLDEEPMDESEYNAPDDPVIWTVSVFGESEAKVVQCECGKQLAKGETCPKCKVSNK